MWFHFFLGEMRFLNIVAKGEINNEIIGKRMNKNKEINILNHETLKIYSKKWIGEGKIHEKWESVDYTQVNQ